MLTATDPTSTLLTSITHAKGKTRAKVASDNSQNSSNHFCVAVRVRPLFANKSQINPNIPRGKEDQDFVLASLNGRLRSSSTTQPPAAPDRIVSVVDDHMLIFGKNKSNLLIKDPSRTTAEKSQYSHGSKRRKEMRYAFDRVFAEEATQQQVYEGTTQQLIDEVLNGYNATVFAYGATGCGKTHTITGTAEDPGIIYRAMQELFEHIQKSDKVTEVTLSYLEVYNETIRDLLVPGQPLDLREDENKVVVTGLSEHRPKCRDDIMKMLIHGNNNRTKAPTEANAVSSRSHAVLQIHVRSRSKSSGSHASVSFATLSIIDLAGSERASVTKNSGERLLEGANINRSLLALGNCINALCSDKSNHIPYRDSKLTRLLKFSLGGNCKVTMIVNVSPDPVHYEETHNTLKYANRAKNIKTKAIQNKVDIDLHMSQYPKLIAELQERIAFLESNSTKTQTQSLSSVAMDPQVLLEMQSVIDSFFEKMKPKAIELAASQAAVDMNDKRVSQLKLLLQCIPCSETLHVDDSLLDMKNKVFKAIDDLHTANATLRHSISQLEASLVLLEQKLDKKLFGECSIFKNEVSSSVFVREEIGKSMIVFKNQLERFKQEKKQSFILDCFDKMQKDFGTVLEMQFRLLENLYKDVPLVNHAWITNIQFVLNQVLASPAYFCGSNGGVVDIVEASIYLDTVSEADTEANTSFEPNHDLPVEHEAVDLTLACDRLLARTDQVLTRQISSLSIHGTPTEKLTSVLHSTPSTVKALKSPESHYNTSKKSSTTKSSTVSKRKRAKATRGQRKKRGIDDDSCTASRTTASEVSDCGGHESEDDVPIVAAENPGIGKMEDDMVTPTLSRITQQFITDPVAHVNSPGCTAVMTSDELVTSFMKQAAAPIIHSDRLNDVVSPTKSGPIRCSPARREKRNHVRRSLIPVLRPSVSSPNLKTSTLSPLKNVLATVHENEKLKPSNLGQVGWTSHTSKPFSPRILRSSHSVRNLKSQAGNMAKVGTAKAPLKTPADRSSRASSLAISETEACDVERRLTRSVSRGVRKEQTTPARSARLSNRRAKDQ